MTLDDGPVMPLPPDGIAEKSAGAALVQMVAGEPQVLVIRTRANGYELPKGHVKPGETAGRGGLRELYEETAVEGRLEVGRSLGSVEYSFEVDLLSIRKQVEFFLVTPNGEVRFGTLPRRTRERRWICANQMDRLPLVDENLRGILRCSLLGKAKGCEAEASTTTACVARL